jgi:peptidyl-prolyl cis-trans isomerase D
MLSWLSRKERTHKVVLIFFAVLMAVSLVAFYAPNQGGATVDPSKSTEPLAMVAGDPVTLGELTRQKDMYRRAFGGQISIAQLGGNTGLLKGLIRGKVEAYEANRLGFTASDAEVAEAVREQFRDPAGGAFNVDRYKQSVAAQFGSVASFEEEIRKDIARKKLNAFVTASVRVSDEEVQDKYKRDNTIFDVTYVPITVDKLVEKINLSDEELRQYYESHKEEFKFESSSKKIRYLLVNTNKVSEKLTIPDEELKKEYDSLSAENKQAGVKVQQIVLKVARPDLDESVKAKATEIAAKLRSGKDTVTEEAFAEAAKGNSEDPATAKNGGWLANVVKKNPSKPSDPLQQTLTMQPGELTEPIKHGNAYYIFRRGEAVPKSFEEAKKELLVSLRNRKSYTAAKEIAERAAKSIKESKDIQKASDEFAAESNMKPSEMIFETPFIKPQDDVPNIGNSPQFEDAIAPLENINDVGDPVNIRDGFAIPMLVDKRDPGYYPSFEEAKEQVKKKASEAKAKEQLEQVAREIAAVNQPGDMKAVADKYGLEVKTETGYKVGSSLGGIIMNETLNHAIYSLKANELTKNPIKVGEQWVVVGATKRTDADMAEFAKQRDQLIQTALSTKRNEVYADYIQAVQDRLEKDGKIKMLEERIKQLEEEEPPSFMPQFPGGFQG